MTKSVRTMRDAMSVIWLAAGPVVLIVLVIALPMALMALGSWLDPERGAGLGYGLAALWTLAFVMVVSRWILRAIRRREPS
ncbi:hypothetical protein [Alsobacter sp. R-9]